MAISETTKQVVAQQRRTLRGAYDRNVKDIEHYQVNILALQAANVALKKEYDALTKDIPEPTPPPEE